MVSSRCGVVCDSFTCKDKFGFDCKGCVNTHLLPWGECQIKNCVEEKKINHCGECNEFPCSILRAFAYDPVHGDKGKRIEQCETWNNEKLGV